MKNKEKKLIDSLTPHKLSEDEVNKLLDSIVEMTKNKPLLTLTCEDCHRDLIPDKDDFYDSEDGVYCSDCMAKREAELQNLLDL